jgi:hypothetical protein
MAGAGCCTIARIFKVGFDNVILSVPPVRRDREGVRVLTTCAEGRVGQGHALPTKRDRVPRVAPKETRRY